MLKAEGRSLKTRIYGSFSIQYQRKKGGKGNELRKKRNNKNEITKKKIVLMSMEGKFIILKASMRYSILCASQSIMDPIPKILLLFVSLNHSH